MKTISIFPRAQPLQTTLAIVLFIGMSSMIFAALGFQYIVGFVPCKLCLMERTPYYIGAPLMLITAYLSAIHFADIYVRKLFLAILALMTYGFILSLYHVGTEWKFWKGPAACSFPAIFILKNAADLLDSLNMFRPISCSEAPGYFLGLSIGGWNAILSLVYAAIAFFAARTPGKIYH
ncbi:MAG: Disulfide bond formation protein B [Candidatus Tokpelaia sp. JSC085]|nr:MAG: Disulfide bond formation protein B [Candidatus Tokpelaia sp. JSC085]